jgi:hypothetical protein
MSFAPGGAKLERAPTGEKAAATMNPQDDDRFDLVPQPLFASRAAARCSGPPGGRDGAVKRAVGTAVERARGRAGSPSATKGGSDAAG